MTTDRGGGPVVLCILDGFGIGDDPTRNPLLGAARMPNWDRLNATWPHARLKAAGEAVGLPSGQMGNSEVDHLNLGAGFPVLQDLPRINRAIADGSFFGNDALVTAARRASIGIGRLHLMALLGPGGVHAIDDHLLGMVELAHRQGVPAERVLIHLITDGRDTPPRSASAYLRALVSAIDGKARIATVAGRFWAMDRDQRWERTARAYAAVVHADGPRHASAEEVLAEVAANEVGDEFIEPAVVGDYSGLADGDSFVHLNFRADRARQFIRALVLPTFDGFERGNRPSDLAITTLTEYQDQAELPVAVAFGPVEVPSLAGHLAAHGLRQLHVAETEKYAHVTYFFNGGRETPFPGEDRVLVPSRRDIPTYDLAPEMSAAPITDVVIEALAADAHRFIVVNYANADMVGHTGDWQAAIAAVEVLDGCLGRLTDAASAHNATLLITGDHGNIEQMRDEDGHPQTKHTTSDVPLLAVGETTRDKVLADGALSDVAPTICALLGLPSGPGMTGRDLFAPSVSADPAEAG